MGNKTPFGRKKLIENQISYLEKLTTNPSIQNKIDYLTDALIDIDNEGSELREMQTTIMVVMSELAEHHEFESFFKSKLEDIWNYLQNRKNDL